MEEDIKIIENFINTLKNMKTKEKLVQAIENLIKGYRDLMMLIPVNTFCNICGITKTWYYVLQDTMSRYEIYEKYCKEHTIEKCIICGKDVPKTRIKSKTCSRKCYATAYKRNWRVK